MRVNSNRYLHKFRSCFVVMYQKLFIATQHNSLLAHTGFKYLVHKVLSYQQRLAGSRLKVMTIGIWGDLPVYAAEYSGNTQL